MSRERDDYDPDLWGEYDDEDLPQGWFGQQNNVPMPPKPTPPTTGGASGGGSPEDDAARGLVGGYYDPRTGLWVSGEPRSGGGGGYGGGTSGLSGGGWGAAPTYTAPDWIDPGEFDPGPAFTYKDFLAPDPSKVGEDPAFQFRFNQGLKALSANKAGQGTFRSGATGQALQDYGQNAASQEYNNIWNRSLSEYDTNRNNAFGSWAAQYGQRKDKYGFHASNTQNRNIFNQGNATNLWRSLFDAWSKQGDWENSYLTTLANDPG